MEKQPLVVLTDSYGSRENQTVNRACQGNKWRDHIC